MKIQGPWSKSYEEFQVGDSRVLNWEVPAGCTGCPQRQGATGWLKLRFPPASWEFIHTVASQPQPNANSRPSKNLLDSARAQWARVWAGGEKQLGCWRHQSMAVCAKCPGRPEVTLSTELGWPGASSTSVLPFFLPLVYLLSTSMGHPWMWGQCQESSHLQLLQPRLHSSGWLSLCTLCCKILSTCLWKAVPQWPNDHSSDNPRSLTHWGTREHWSPVLICLQYSNRWVFWKNKA